MGLKSFRPITPSMRFKVLPDFSEITKRRPERSLTEPKRKTGGRDNRGRITCRHQGGGAKQRYRIIDFKRSKRGVEASVVGIEYDPNRTCRIALIQYTDGEKAYILAPAGLGVGDKVSAGENAEPKVGNALPLSTIPLGASIHNVELTPGRGGQIARSAGSSVQLVARENEYASVRMPSGEIRRINVECMATIGQVGNLDHENISIGKAGRSRWLGRKPHVRGVAMNPVDHPLGGGEGKTSGGRHPVTPWGQPTKGFKTRRRKDTDRFIVQRRTK